ncbi:hypothetical protein C1Y22_36930, partial [Pseudomonas sp. MPR-R2A5]|uniref:hypothetical protein n=1 Tax=Pseudomonas sp. MPR-R2A5 TaxID=2070622 RepID=UPI000CB6E11F
AQTKPAPVPPPAPKAAKKAGASKAPKKAAASAPAAGQASAPASAAPEESKVARRDPFESLTSRQEAAARAGANLPPGKAGLQVGT